MTNKKCLHDGVFMPYNLNDLETRVVENEYAKRFVSKYHYSKTCSNIVVAIGQWLGLDLKCVVVFNYCSGREMAQQVMRGGDNTNTLELSRLVSFEPKPKYLESRAISKAFKWLKKNMPNIKVVISYADNSVGHHGYIYQATNFIYYGQSRQVPKCFIDGKRIHDRILHSRYGSASHDEVKKILGDRFVVKKEEKTKSRYYILLSQSKRERKELQKNILVNSVSYPKGDNQKYDIFVNGDFSVLDESDAKQKTVGDLTRQTTIFDFLDEEGK